MAPLTYADIASPKGWVERSQHFPTDDAPTFQLRLATYLAEGYDDWRVAALPTVIDPDFPAEPTQNSAAKLWAYYRAADAIVKRMTSVEWSATKQGEGARSQDKAQLDEWIRLRDGYLAQFEAVVTPDEEETADSPIQPTVALPTDVEWG
jgi:hypothetical protein